MARRKVKNYSFLKGFDYYIPGWGGICALAGLLILGALIGGAVMRLLSLFMSPEDVNSYGILITYPLQFVPAMIFAAFMSRRNAGFDRGLALDSSHYGRAGFWRLALLVVPATFCAAFMTDAVTALLPPMPEHIKRLLDGMAGGPVWVSLLSVSVMAPLFEEWLCRGEVLRGLLTKVAPVWAIVLSAAFFAIIHMNPWQALPAFILGCLFGYVYYKTGSLKLTMLMHCANNTLSVICMHINALKDADTWLDVLTQGQYALGFAGAAIVVLLLIATLRRIPLEGAAGNCDAVEAGLEG